LKAKSPATKVIVAEPEAAPLIQSGTPQDYNEDDTPASSHTSFTPHPIQGWSPDFIPKLANDVSEAGHIDEMMAISGPDAIAAAQQLALSEGIFCGISGGATFAAALRVAESAPAGSKILAMIPDTGERYLSTPLFGEIEAEMNDEEQALADSI
jgi:cysteine synthase A